MSVDKILRDYDDAIIALYEKVFKEALGTVPSNIEFKIQIGHFWFQNVKFKVQWGKIYQYVGGSSDEDDCWFSLYSTEPRNVKFVLKTGSKVLENFERELREGIERDRRRVILREEKEKKKERELENKLKKMMGKRK